MFGSVIERAPRQILRVNRQRDFEDE